nr:MAG TPA: hypothetical protein [Caudoviricetes sp.]
MNITDRCPLRIFRGGQYFFEKTSFFPVSQGYLSEGRKIPRKER